MSATPVTSLTATLYPSDAAALRYDGYYLCDRLPAAPGCARRLWLWPDGRWRSEDDPGPGARSGRFAPAGDRLVFRARLGGVGPYELAWALLPEPPGRLVSDDGAVYTFRPAEGGAEGPPLSARPVVWEPAAFEYTRGRVRHRLDLEVVEHVEFPWPPGEGGPVHVFFRDGTRAVVPLPADDVARLRAAVRAAGPG